jgi:hypothetical protein
VVENSLPLVGEGWGEGDCLLSVIVLPAAYYLL